MIKLNYSALSKSIHYLSLALIVITMPFSILANNICIFLFILNWIFIGNLPYKLKESFNNKTTIIFILLFLVFVFGLLYSDDLKKGFFNIEKKLSLLVFPLILGSSGKISYRKKIKILLYFVLSSEIAIVFCLVRALYIYISTDSTTFFFYHSLSSTLNLHAVYLSLFCGFALFISLYFLFLEKRKYPGIFKLIFLSSIPMLLIGILLLSSKLIIVISFIIFAGIGIFYLLKKKNIFQNHSIFLFLLLILFLILSVFEIQPIRKRFSDILSNNYQYVINDQYNPITPFTGLTLRVTIWKFILKINKENNSYLFGVGTGDGQGELNQRYKDHNMYIGVPGTEDVGFLNYNAHNQFFEMFLSLGLVGLGIYLINIYEAFRISIKSRNWIYLIFIVFIVSLSCTESILGLNKGVVFFGFFNSFFAFNNINE